METLSREDVDTLSKFFTAELSDELDGVGSFKRFKRVQDRLVEALKEKDAKEWLLDALVWRNATGQPEEQGVCVGDGRSSERQSGASGGSAEEGRLGAAT